VELEFVLLVELAKSGGELAAEDAAGDQAGAWEKQYQKLAARMVERMVRTMTSKSLAIRPPKLSDATVLHR
jgi:hypothetical protein